MEGFEAALHAALVLDERVTAYSLLAANLTLTSVALAFFAPLVRRRDSCPLNPQNAGKHKEKACLQTPKTL